MGGVLEQTNNLDHMFVCGSKVWIYIAYAKGWPWSTLWIMVNHLDQKVRKIFACTNESRLGKRNPITVSEKQTDIPESVILAPLSSSFQSGEYFWWIPSNLRSEVYVYLPTVSRFRSDSLIQDTCKWNLTLSAAVHYTNYHRPIPQVVHTAVH